MASRWRSAKRRPARGLVPRVESLETRDLLAAAFPGVTLDPLLVPKFVRDVPNPLDPGFIFRPTAPGGSHYEVGIYQTQQDLGLGLTDPDGRPVLTTVWGYGTSLQDVTYPGRTFVAWQDQPITVRWTNNLVDASGTPLPHLLPVDPTLHWADPPGLGHGPGPYTGPVPVVTHLHGGHTRSDSDGLPDAWFTPDSRDADALPDYTGRLYNPVYTYDNDQQAATLWYHDHALGVTRLNVYAGLAGFYILRDAVDTGAPSNPLGLPGGKYEVPLVIQDRLFTEGGQLYYPAEPEAEGEPSPNHLPEFFGDTILVNGQAWPKLDVEPRAYRFRLLNGSDSRFYNLQFGPGGPRFYQIGGDGGLLAAPVALDQLLLAPGERADVIVDFSGRTGQSFILQNNAPGPFKGELREGELAYPETTDQLMAFRVVKKLNKGIPDRGVPATLIPPPTPLTPTGPTRKLLLFEGTDGHGRLQSMLGVAAPTTDAAGELVDGTLLWDDPVTENPQLNSVEVWEIYNSTEDAHPLHLHLVQFQVLNRQRFGANITPKPMDDGVTGGTLSRLRLLGRPDGPEANETGWKDTVVMNPGEVTRIIARFDRPGEYVWHCHILSHEDHEMMRRYVVVAPTLARRTTAAGPPGAELVPLLEVSSGEATGFVLEERGQGEALPDMRQTVAPSVAPGRGPTLAGLRRDEGPDTSRNKDKRDMYSILAAVERLPLRNDDLVFITWDNR